MNKLKLNNMPKPHKNENESDYMKRCIPQLISEGKPQEQAIAICHSMFENFEAEIPKTSKIGYDYELIKNNVECQLQAYGMVLNKNQVFIFTNTDKNDDIFQIARMCSIPYDNIIFTNNNNKYMDYNQLETYYTTNIDEAKLINEKTKCLAQIIK